MITTNFKQSIRAIKLFIATFLAVYIIRCPLQFLIFLIIIVFFKNDNSKIKFSKKREKLFFNLEQNIFFIYRLNILTKRIYFLIY